MTSLLAKRDMRGEEGGNKGEARVSDCTVKVTTVTGHKCMHMLM